MVGVASAYFGSEGSQPLPTKSISDMLDAGTDTLNFYDVQRQRSQKFAQSFIGDRGQPVRELVSAGTTSITSEVVASRRAFQDFRRMQILMQWWKISGDAAYLNAVIAMITIWAQTNMIGTPGPDRGHPINQTHFEGLHWTLRTIAPGGTHGVFDSALYTSTIYPWLQRILTATLAWPFPAEAGGGKLAFGNHYTHHLQQLVMLYESMGNFAAQDALFSDIDAHAAKNFPWGQPNDDTGVEYPANWTVGAASTSTRTFVISTRRTRVYSTGFAFTISGGPNAGSYTCRQAATYSGGNTTIYVNETVASNTSGGTIVEVFNVKYHDMKRASSDPGESIDFIRRDAFHYQAYDLLPWVNIGHTESLRTKALTGTYGTRYVSVIENGFNWLWANHFNNADGHTEFALSTDEFDELRWEGSHSEYLQPDTFWLPDEGGRLIMNYYNWRLMIDPSFPVNDALLGLSFRGDRIATDWAYWLRFTLGA